MIIINSPPKILLIIFFISLLLGSCSITKNPQELLVDTPLESQPLITVTPVLLPVNTPTNEQIPTSQPVNVETEFDLPDYKIKVSFNYGNQTANINETIRFFNTSTQPLNQLLLACDTLRYPGSFVLKKIIINNATEIDIEPEKFFLTIPLPEPLLPGEEINIEIDYLLKVPPIPPPADDRKPGIFGYSTLQTNFVDWYPFIPPLSENGEWVLHEPWFYGEYLVYDLANFHVEIELLNTPLGSTIAASTLPTILEENRFIYESFGARNFVWSMSPSFIVESLEMEGITITTHTFPFHQKAGSHVLQESAKAIDLYSRLFSPYPRENLTIVEADFLDGMEYDGLFFLSRGFYNLFDNTPQNYLTAIAVHETAHQWWYAAIANDQALEPWLDEALCTYSELLFYEEYYPELVNWWWEYRVNFYQPEGFINKSIYDYQGFIPYRNATYLQGAKFLQNLRDDLGDEVFFDFLSEYARSQNNKISNESNFFQILGNYTNQDVKKNYPQYFSLVQ
ncbi:MAG: M1 family metallopeptidase [Anaerolineaceae bacterium]|nr:M1 family metallopeptidase [Anaerolineaceae bacterium]